MNFDKVKIKDLKIDDVLLDKNDIEVVVIEISPFDDEEMLVWVRDVIDGIARIGTNPKDATVKKIRKE